MAELLDLELAFRSQEQAFRAVARSPRQAPKFYVDAAPGYAVAFGQAARTDPRAGPVLKFGAIAEHNPARGLPSIHAVVVALDGQTGAPAAIMNAETLTVLRTAAASAVAADVLAQRGASVLAVLGSGRQARAHVSALARVRDLREVRVWSPTPAHREEAAAELDAAMSADVRSAATAAAALEGAHLVAACTYSPTPVVAGALLPEGACVVSVGSHSAERSELDDVTLARAEVVVVDDRPTALAHCGALIGGLGRGVLDDERVACLGEILEDRSRLPDGPGLRVFVSVGIGIQDATAAWAVVERARERGLGREVRL